MKISFEVELEFSMKQKVLDSVPITIKKGPTSLKLCMKTHRAVRKTREAEKRWKTARTASTGDNDRRQGAGSGTTMDLRVAGATHGTGLNANIGMLVDVESGPTEQPSDAQKTAVNTSRNR